MTTNTSASGNSTATNITTAAPAGANITGTIWQQCGTPEADTICGQSLYPPEFFTGVQELLSLKATAAGANTQMRLSSWRPSIPPCTNHSSSANATCVVCDEAEPLSSCGRPRASDGQMLCNWRFVECRARQVVAINMARKVGAGALV
jgi:hypothetical protein